MRCVAMILTLCAVTSVCGQGLWDNTTPDTYQAIVDLRAQMFLSSTENVLKTQEIADKLGEAYQCEKLLIVATATQEKGLFVAEMQMAPGYLKSEVYIGDPENGPTFVFTLDKEMFLEQRFSPTLVAKQYPSPTPWGAKNIFLAGDTYSQYWCLLGGCIQTWLGGESWVVKTFQRQILTGDYLGQVKEDGQLCDLIAHEVRRETDRGISWICNTFYVAQDGKLLRRDSFRVTEYHQKSPEFYSRWVYEYPQYTNIERDGKVEEKGGELLENKILCLTLAFQ